MNIGIIVYSHTGHTLSVAKKLEKAIIDKGHKVKVELVEQVDKEPKPANQVVLKNSPDLSGYDFVIFASPVQGMQLAGVMKKYLSSLPKYCEINGYCFVTRYFMKRWLGGNSSIKWIENTCHEKGIKIIKNTMISWSSKSLDADIAEAISYLSLI